MAELESSLDLRLFERGARILKLTQEGRALYERTGALLTELDETAAAIASGGGQAARQVADQRAVAVLADRDGKDRRRVRAADIREVRLEVTTEDRAVDMVEEGYDLVIRVNPDPDESLVGRIFLRDRLVVVASPDLKRPKDNRAVPAVMRGAGDQMTTWEVTIADWNDRASRSIQSFGCHRSSWSAMRSGRASALRAFRCHW